MAANTSSATPASPTKTGGATSAFTPEKIFGAGVWKSGTVVRDIEGHFHKENEPRDVDPIDETGGVPGVDLKDRIKGALTGKGAEYEHEKSAAKHGETTSAAGTTGSSGLTGTTGGATGLTGSTGTTGHSGATGTTGITGTTGSSLPSSGVTATSGTGTGHHTAGADVAATTAAATGAGAAGLGSHSSTTPGSGIASQLRQSQSASTGAATDTSGIAPHAATGTSHTAATGATHGISDTAERDLRSESQKAAGVHSNPQSFANVESDKAGYTPKETTASSAATGTTTTGSTGAHTPTKAADTSARHSEESHEKGGFLGKLKKMLD